MQEPIEITGRGRKRRWTKPAGTNGMWVRELNSRGRGDGPIGVTDDRRHTRNWRADRAGREALDQKVG